jgi:hypothetical protein
LLIAWSIIASACAAVTVESFINVVNVVYVTV